MNFFREGFDCCHDSPTPDDNVFKELALTYASRNPTMHAGDACKPDYFPNGIVNGAKWYEVKGMHMILLNFSILFQKY